MGVPKFFRWMSERYPAISQLIAENRIPEFDCLYLDMNGIIHNCTHKDSDSPTFRMTEDKMFIAIFNYIEHLFGKIKPKKLFFMAIDGVAPRAKMNQQRARRFRTALDNERAREKAIKEGVEMPTEDAFDSNCITPGTEFMAKLTQQLKYFISKKISEDVDWRGVEIVLSGHEVPGEGEHKIMEYIRQAKSQQNYDPNRRHCLYGLDADLIMLGLLSHDPHFCLLREEVTFGRQSKVKSKELEHQNFFLMHLCMVREYLELEFQELGEPGALDFPFDMERVIDDFILMAFFVGNDFLPNLPHLHINEGALALMFGVYKSVLPKAKGYINEGGVINLDRLKILLEELSHVEYRFFESENSDAAWLKGKQGREDDMERTKRRGQLVISTPQKALFESVKAYVTDPEAKTGAANLDLPTTLPARDRKFVEELADSLNLQWRTVQNSEGERHLQLSFPPKISSRISDDDDENDNDENDDDDEEAQNALARVLKRYSNAKLEDVFADEAQHIMQQQYQAKFNKWKDTHYQTKFGWSRDNKEELKKLTENYVQGLQWVLYYYYRGVASWPWFYGYHYSPMISDVIEGLKADLNFNLGQPFRPFQQLMGVLPDRSKKIVPTVYHDLMTSNESPIIDFYPRDFELDMDGKKMEWEAVVKIPFIEEQRLLSAMATKEHLLSDDERARNEFGVSLKFVYNPDQDYVYPSSLPGIFPDLPHCHCVENIFELPTMDGLDLYVGLMDGVKLGAAALAGFPSLKVLDFIGQLGFHGVTVFQQESRNESTVITLSHPESAVNVAAAQAKLGKAVHVGYPYLQEGKVVKVSDELFDYTLSDDGLAHVIQTPHAPQEISNWKKKADRIENVYSKRFGIITGPVESLVHVDMLKGLQKTDEGATVKEYGEVIGIDTDYATQTVVNEVISVDQRFIEKEALPMAEEFPEGSKAFFLGEFAYGKPLQVLSHDGERANVWVLTPQGREPEFGREVVYTVERSTPYTPAFAVAKMLHLSPLVLSKLTSSFSVESNGVRLNLGLNLKFEGKKLKVLGYSRRSDSGWEFSNKAIQLIQQYMINFPDFIAGIMRKPKGDIYKDVDFFSEEEAFKKVKEIGAWLKEINSKGFEKVPLDAQQLDSDAVKALEEAADKILPSLATPQAKRLNGVPRTALIKPADAEHRLGTQRFTLGDRVVYLLETGRVPIGQRGTVIGITKSARIDYLDVVFDNTFMSGSTLDQRCTAFRGATVPANSVLNLTDKQFITETQAGSARKPQPKTQPLYIQQGYGPALGPSGRGQLIPASAPPPITDFRSVIVGQTNGHGANGAVRGGGPAGRGRGTNPTNGHLRQTQTELSVRGAPPNRGNQPVRGRGGRGTDPSTIQRSRGRGNRSGYNVVDMDDTTEGVVASNPNFQPRSYNNVPPPNSLNAPSRGRGRGRGERGAQRGRGAPRGRAADVQPQ